MERLPTLIAVTLLGFSCTEMPAPEPAPGEGLQSNRPRQEAPEVTAEDRRALAEGNAAFAWSLYQALGEEAPNLVFSPASISIALAMTYAGAGGETAAQMARALRFELPAERLHQGFNWLDLELAARGEEASAEEGDPFRLRVVNQLWGQQGHLFQRPFLDLLAGSYGAGLRLLDFVAAPGPSRVTINDWVAEQTEGRIEDLLPPGSIDALTRLVLTNAVYFNASWAVPFVPEATRDRTFHNADGSSATVPLMERVGTDIRYAEGEGWEAVELAYTGGELSMVVLVPEAGRFGEVEASLSAERVATIVGRLGRSNVRLSLPRFTIELPVALRSTLVGMGMVDAFDPDRADFSGIAEDPDLHVSDVVHQAFIAVDEEGTEAAAATGVVLSVTSAPPPPRVVTVDRPFVYFIRDAPTGTVLFAGRVTQLGQG